MSYYGKRRAEQRALEMENGIEKTTKSTLKRCIAPNKLRLSIQELFGKESHKSDFYIGYFIM